MVYAAWCNGRLCQRNSYLFEMYCYMQQSLASLHRGETSYHGSNIWKGRGLGSLHRDQTSIAKRSGMACHGSFAESGRDQKCRKFFSQIKKWSIFSLDIVEPGGVFSTYICVIGSHWPPAEWFNIRETRCFRGDGGNVTFCRSEMAPFSFSCDHSGLPSLH